MTNAEATWHDTMLIVAEGAIKRLADSRDESDQRAAADYRTLMDEAFAQLSAEVLAQEASFIADPLDSPSLRESARIGREIHLAVNRH